MQVLGSRLGRSLVVPDGGYDLPDIQPPADKAGPPPARAIEELNERVDVMAQALLDVALSERTFSNMGASGTLPEPQPRASCQPQGVVVSHGHKGTTAWHIVPLKATGRTSGGQDHAVRRGGGWLPVRLR